MRKLTLIKDPYGQCESGKSVSGLNVYVNTTGKFVERSVTSRYVHIYAELISLYFVQYSKVSCILKRGMSLSGGLYT